VRVSIAIAAVRAAESCGALSVAERRLVRSPEAAGADAAVTAAIATAQLASRACRGRTVPNRRW